jgi:hypothetical protein
MTFDEYNLRKRVAKSQEPQTNHTLEKESRLMRKQPKSERGTQDLIQKLKEELRKAHTRSPKEGGNTGAHIDCQWSNC